MSTFGINALTGLPNRTSEMRENVIIEGNLTVVGTLTVKNTLPASTYSLGAASTYVILSTNVLTNGTAILLLNGNVGHSGATAGTGAMAFTAGADQQYPADATALADSLTLYNQLTGLTPTFSFPTGAVQLDTESTHGTAGVYTPGIYRGDAACNTTAGSTITLNGAGDYVFVFVGAITTGANTIISLTNGATANRVYWVTNAALTTGANTSFVGTALAGAAITTGANTIVNGEIITVTSGATGNITIGAGNIIQAAH